MRIVHRFSSLRNPCCAYLEVHNLILRVYRNSSRAFKGMHFKTLCLSSFLFEAPGPTGPAFLNGQKTIPATENLDHKKDISCSLAALP